MSGHLTIFQKIAYSANFGHNGSKTTMFEKGRVSFSESHMLGLCGSEVKTCLHWSAYRTNWAPTLPDEIPFEHSFFLHLMFCHE